MEVKIIKSERKGDPLKIYIEEILIKEVHEPFFKKYLTQIQKFTHFSTEFLTLEKKIAFEYALKLLAKRGYTTLELTKKLKEKLLSEASINHALEKMAPYLDDEKLIKAMIDSYFRRGKGEKMIYLLLRAKSPFPKEKILSWIKEAYPDEMVLERAEELLQKKFKERRKETKSKAYRFLLNRGFQEELAYRATLKFCYDSC